MRILFFLVHPARYHFFKHTINYLKTKGHTVDVIIITKDVLEDLVQQEGWKYTNIFPEGRRNPNLPILLATGVNFFKSVYRLYRYTKGKKYDLFINDCLVVIGKLKNTPSLIFSDTDLATVPENAVLYHFATKIIAPDCTNLGRFEKKKIGVKGYKELAYLHPNYLTPDKSIIKTFNPDEKKYAILRFVSMTAVHDRGKSGMSNEDAQKIIRLLTEYNYNVFITSERELAPEFEPYRIQINPADIAHALYFADMFIGDSQTMTSEAALLGTPALRCNDFVGRLRSMEEKEEKYGLTFGFRTSDFDKLLIKIQELATTPNLEAEWQKRKQMMLDDKIDVTQLLRHIMEHYHEYI